MQPVSYTHLDVYKRQALYCLCIVLFICIVITTIADFLNPVIHTVIHKSIFSNHIPVSYTHLITWEKREKKPNSLLGKKRASCFHKKDSKMLQ